MDTRRREEITRVAKGEAKIKRKSAFERIGKKIADDASNIPDHLICDILLPALEDTVLDLIEFAIHDLFGSFYGGYDDDYDRDFRRRRVGGSIRSSHRDYSGASRGRRRSSRSLDDSYDVMEIELSYDDVYRVKNTMLRRLEEYGDVTVAEYYQICGLNDYDSQANRWGWTNLNGIKARVLRNGDYILNLPRTEPV